MNASNRLLLPRLWQAVGWLLVAAVTILSVIPAPPQPFVLWDKASHLLAYAGLMLWFRQAFSPRVRWIVFLIALGVVLELVQGGLGYRDLELADMVANTLGVASGLGLAQTPLGSLVAWLDRALGHR